MRNKVLTLGLMTVFLGITSCSDDTPISGTPLEQGSEIKFGSALEPTSDIITRTHYGNPTDPDADGRVFWPIYWNAAPNNDHIFIYSPQGAQGRNQANYTVVPENDNSSKAADITKDDVAGVQAGPTSTNYKFYGMYPASSVKGEATGTSISATLSPDQNVSFAGTKANPTTNLPSTNTVGNIAYLTKPDMNNSLMTANETVASLTNEPVVLHFKPFTSVIDITITGPVDNNTITEQNLAAITSVEVIADVNIAGDFTYNFESNSDTNPFTFGENGTNSIVIYTSGTDAEGNRSGITLANQNTLNLQAFILPNPDLKELKILVHTSDSQTWTKSLTMTNFKATQIHPVALPALKFAEAEFDYSVWLSQLDPRIYISEISLPGACMSSSYRLTGDDQVQTLALTDQFNAGVRVFQTHAWIYSGKGQIDDVDSHIGLNMNGGNEVVSLYEALTELQHEMEQNHGNEFCVLMISDYAVNNTSYSQTDFMNRLRVVVNKLVAEGIVASNVTPNTTIADVKGKIIIKFQLNGDGGCAEDGDVVRAIQAGGSEGTSDTNAFLAKIRDWSALNNADMLFNYFTRKATTNLFYCPMVFRQIGGFEIASNFTGALSGWDKATIRNQTPGLALDCANILLGNANHNTVTGWYSNINPTSEPTRNFDNTTNMWFMFAEQADPGNTRYTEYYQQSLNNISNVVNCFEPTYKRDYHNKFYMIYCGGRGSSAHPTGDIATTFAKTWSDAVGTNKAWGSKPFGWVMFNRVLLPTKENQSNEVVMAIQKVISQNNDTDYKLNRDYNRDVTPQVSPTGNTKGTVKGGNLFSK